MDVKKLQDLFAVQNRHFKIPSYQRSFSWEAAQIYQFVEDLETATGQYYLGHFLFEKDLDGKTLYVVDGQQRLTTCVIFFSCLAQVLSDRRFNGEDIDFEIDDIVNFYVKDLRKQTQKLETVDEDNHYFLDSVIERVNPVHIAEETTTSQRRIALAKGIFEKKFEDTSTEELIRWCNLVQNASVTYFIVSNKIQAAQIFAFQNDRGKPLSKLEIVKAYFMLKIYLHSENPEIAAQNIKYLEGHFADIYKKIVRISLHEDDVLNYYWRSSSYKGYNSGEVVEEIKAEIKEFEKKHKTKAVYHHQEGKNTEIDFVETDEKYSGQEIIEVIKEIVAGISQAFSTVEKIEKSTDCYVVDLRHLNNMALAYPFFMAVDRLNVTQATFHRLSHFLENITFRNLLRGGRADIRSRLNDFLTMLIGIHICDDVDEQINLRIGDMIYCLETSDWWSYWNDNEMKNLLDSGYFYQNRVDNYVLWKYEMYLSDKGYPTPPSLTYEDLIHNESIEHIAPQTPTNDNPTVNGYGEYQGENGIVSGGWLNCLGNLMLISQSHNSAIGNRAFELKLASYGKDNLLNQQKEIQEFVENKDHPVWDVKAIEKRQQKIIAAAMDIWDLNKI